MMHPIKSIVGIGASAGGLEAIQAFFSHMPLTKQLTFVVVQHLSPNFASMMDELLAHNTNMPIIKAKNNMLLEAGTIYLIPAKFSAIIDKGQFKLNKLKTNTLEMPINIFLESLAQYKRNAIGIIMSGTGIDGTLGIQKISQNNGLTIAQKSTEAKFSEMPNSAIQSGKIDHILAAQEMPNTIIKHIQTIPKKNNNNHKNNSKYDLIFQLLEIQYDIDFKAYKTGTLSRRIERRMKILSIETLDAYWAYLKNNSEELKNLYNDLLIGVTSFFRDADAFSALEMNVIPELFAKSKQVNSDIRIWVSPCATGEEAYSLAILFKKYADKHHYSFNVKIFASDISYDAIQKAKKGIYTQKEISQIPTAIRKKYFIKNKNDYEIIPELKKCILFTVHNIITDPPFTKIDLVCCRNLLIYIKPKEQKNIIDLLRFSLNIGGFLLLGSSESILALETDLIVKNKNWRIYQKIKRSNIPLIATKLFPKTYAKEHPSLLSHEIPKDLPLYVYNAILNEIIYAGFIMDKAYNLIHSIGQARKLILLPAGAPILILTNIIIDDLKAPLIAGLHQAKTNLKPAIYHNIIINANFFDKKSIEIGVYPIFDSNNQISYYWIRFDDIKQPLKTPKNISLSPLVKNTQNEKLILAYENELALAKKLLQASLENAQTINEEIQSTNEELMSSNEELKSSNEELQSVNEELYTVNQERSLKIEEIIQAKADIDNLILGAEVNALILNRQLEIRMFTPLIGKIFNLLDHDIGRPLENFRHSLKYNLIISKAKQVLKTKKAFEVEITNNTGRWYLLKILPYYLLPNKDVTGIVITLTDIHDLKMSQQKQRLVEVELKLAMKAGLIGSWRWNLSDDTFIYDETTKLIFGLPNLHKMNTFKKFIATIHKEDKKRLEKILNKITAKKSSLRENFSIILSDKSIRYIACSANLFHDAILNQDHMIGIFWIPN